MGEGKEIGSLYVKLGLDYNGIIGGVGGVSLALNQTLDLFSKFEGMAQGFINLANNAGAMGKEIKDNARDLGLSIAQYQQWTHAAIAAGSSAEEVAGSIRMMSVRIKEARDPASEMSRTLDALGVSALDARGNIRPMHEILVDLFPALNRLPEGFDRNQASMAIFGRGFANVADLASLSREELQALIDMPPALNDEKVNQLDAYNTQLNLLNERMARSQSLAGAELVSSFSTWGEMIDRSLQDGQPLLKFFEGLNLTLEMVAEGITLLGARLIAFDELVRPTSGKFGNMQAFSDTISNADAAVMEMRRKFALAASGYYEGAVWDDATNSWVKPSTGSAGSSSPSVAGSSSPSVAGSSGTVLDATQIRDMNLDLRKLTNVTIPDLRDRLKEVRATGVKRDIEEVEIALEQTINRANDLKTALGQSASLTGEAATYNTMFAAAINAGGVGPDWAGRSNLADMSAAELEEIAAGGLGKSKGDAEKAQLYLSMIGTAGKSGGAGDKKAGAAGSEKKTASLADQSKTDTKTITSELGTQADAYQSLVDTIKTGWADLETTGLIHYFALAEMSRVRSQAELDYMTACVNFAGTNPIVQNKIIVSADGPDWTPAAFTPTQAPTLEAADFSGIALSSAGSGSGGAGSGGEIKVEVNQTINGVDENTTNKVTNATVNGVSKALAGVEYLGGSMI